jgi:hypothetical protein
MKKLSYRKNREQGIVWIETLIVIPFAIALFCGITASNRLVDGNRLVDWAVGQAFLVNGLRPTPTKAVNEERRFTARYRPGPGGGTIEAMPGAPEIPESFKNCGRGTEDVSCGAWITMSTLAKAIHSSQGSSSISYFDVDVTYSDIPVDANTNSSLGRYRKLTVEVSGVFNSDLATKWRSITGLGSTIIPTFRIRRSEAIG